MVQDARPDKVRGRLQSGSLLRHLWIHCSAGKFFDSFVSQVGGDPGRIRTCDTEIRNLVLYPLSYGTTLKRKILLTVIYWKFQFFINGKLVGRQGLLAHVL